MSRFQIGQRVTVRFKEACGDMDVNGIYAGHTGVGSGFTSYPAALVDLELPPGRKNPMAAERTKHRCRIEVPFRYVRSY